MDNAIAFFERNYGYARTKDLKKIGVHTRTILKLLEEGIIEKIKPGLYRLSEFSDVNYVSFVDVCKAVPKAIICLLSAADYFELTTFTPWQVYAAIPHGSKSPNVIYPPTRFLHFRERSFVPGIEIVTIQAGKLRIYNREKTVCDLFRLTAIAGENIAVEALKNYLLWSKNNTGKLRRYMRLLRVENKIAPILKGLTHS
jgi:predicted transcriptional regulator of viral defense system